MYSVFRCEQALQVCHLAEAHSRVHWQELRHLASAGSEQGSNVRKDTESKDASSISEVDTALMQLDGQLETTSNEVAGLQKRLDAFLRNNTSASFLSGKWTETLGHWQSAQKDAERLREELVEDK